MPVPIPLFELRRRSKFFASSLPVSAQTAALTPLFTEFYCQNNGSNINAGSDTNASAKYTSTNGNWSTTTNVFIPTDGTNPVDSGVKTGDWVSIYVDGATTAVYVARVLTVVNAANGAITFVTNGLNGTFGTPPSTSATGRSIKVGGAWKGPNGASAFPFTLNLATAVDANGDWPRINLKNDQTYTLTTSLTILLAQGFVQGYSNIPGDGVLSKSNRATLDFGTTSGNLVLASQQNCWLVDLISTSSLSATGAGDSFRLAGSWCHGFRLTAINARGNGVNLTGSGSKAIECESYGCNRSATAGDGGFQYSTSTACIRCIAANNTGDGFVAPLSVADARVHNCISFLNTRHGFCINPQGATSALFNCDAYRNLGDGLRNLDTTASSNSYIENCNFVRNSGAGIASSSTTGRWTGVVYNCGFGNGSMANLGGKMVNCTNLFESNRVEYDPGVNPWADPDVTGNFQIALLQALGAGRGSFTQTQGGYSGTVGYPDIGAAQHSDSVLIGWDDANVIEPYAYVNHSYTVDWTFDAAVSMSVFSGSLPPGLSLNAISGTEYQITGTPTGVIGTTYTFVLRLIQNSIHQDATYSITVLDDPDQGSAFASGF